MKFNPRYPLRHLSVRVPWHDSNWNGSICSDPLANGSCLALKNCSEKRDDNKEQKLAGISLKVLNEPDYPVCVEERGTFMANFPIPRTLSHPYSFSSKSSHGHLKPTNIILPAFSAPAVPYHWMLKANAKEKKEAYDLNFDDLREPTLDWEGNDIWVQEYENQKSLLNCFFEHFNPGSSLIFFYAKRVPFVEDSGKVLLGVGRINKIIPSEAYEGSNKRFGAAYWEHMILHGIRSGDGDGFLLPYHAAIEHQKLQTEYDLSRVTVVVPNDAHFEFSYAAEHVSTDSSIRVLLSCLESLERAKEDGVPGNHQNGIDWIIREVAELEKLRGPYPGMGTALCAFGIEKGHFIAAEIINNAKDEDPWMLFENALDEPAGILSPELARLIPFNSKKLYQRLVAKAHITRIPFLHLLSRFNLNLDQARTLYIQEDRSAVGIIREEIEYLKNPYLLYEDLRQTNIPVSFITIDLGLFHKDTKVKILPEGSTLSDPFDIFRIRALTIQQLELAALMGHTLLPRSHVINQIRSLQLLPACKINSDYYEMAEECFEGEIVVDEMKNNEPAYQLERLAKYRSVISQKVIARVAAKRLEIGADWKELLDTVLNKFVIGEKDEQEPKARAEKVAALHEIAESRFSVLIGPAGTGKTTLLTVLAGYKEIENNGVLLLAPTGKARVRMAEVAKGLNVISKTLAQFLADYGRYNQITQKYIFSTLYCEQQYDTVILDEASMLTEEMLATTLDCLKSVKRFILVGDHRQLPPIGAGRPFVDIIHFLKTDEIQNKFPRIGNGFAELTIKRRQGGSDREDMQLAEWFGGEAMEPGADSIINKLITTQNSDFLRVEHWDNEKDFEILFERILVDELDLGTLDNVQAFNNSLGANEGKYYNQGQAVNFVEDWQILSPVKEKEFGIRSINRKIHKLFRKDKVEYAWKRNSKIPAPIGLEQIVYGDKVINNSNSRRSNKLVWPQDNSLNYLANGEMGMVIGQFKMSYHKFPGQPQNTEIEFSTQKGYKYTFKASEFREDGDVPLELAYALTVHKAQGSEFKKVFLIVPNPCLLLSREMLYTALTRQKEKVILLFQGSAFDIKGLSSPLRSDTLRRITNLFVKPDLLEMDGKYLEKNLIHQASNGTMLRSKSELMIYQRLLDKGLEPIYERKLTIKGVEKLPDFTLENHDTGENFYWEHCGMLFDSGYQERWEEKYEWYLENDIRSYEEGGGKNGVLIVTKDKPFVLENGSIRGALSIMEVDDIIKKVFNL